MVGKGVKNKFFVALIVITVILGIGSLTSPLKANWVIFQGKIGGGGASSWTDWAETDESGWGDADTYISLFENTSAGGNETGQGGGLSGVDLVLTQIGNVAGATGSPPTRALDGTSNGFTPANAIANLLDSSTGGWTFLVKVKDFEDDAVTAQNIIHSDDGANLSIKIQKNTANKLVFEVLSYDPVDWELQATTTDDVPSTGDLWIALWYDGTVFNGGFTTTKPTKWSDFAAGKRVTDTNTAVKALPSCNILINRTGDDQWAGLEAYYVIFSKTVLIDNAS